MITVPFLVVALVTLIVITILFYNQMGLYTYYSNGTGFMSSMVFFIGSFISLFSLALVGMGMKLEQATKKWVIYMIPLFSIFYFFWCSNLLLRTELWYKGSETPRLTGAMWLFFAILVLALILLYGTSQIVTLTFIPFFWCVYCMWQWLKI